MIKYAITIKGAEFIKFQMWEELRPKFMTQLAINVFDDFLASYCRDAEKSAEKNNGIGYIEWPSCLHKSGCEARTMIPAECFKSIYASE